MRYSIKNAPSGDLCCLDFFGESVIVINFMVKLFHFCYILSQISRPFYIYSAYGLINYMDRK